MIAKIDEPVTLEYSRGVFAPAIRMRRLFFGLGLGLLIVMVMLPLLTPSIGRNPRYFASPCDRKLHQVYVLWQFATEEQSSAVTAPDSLDAIMPDEMTPPIDKEDVLARFVLLPGKTSNDPPSDVLAFEQPGYHGGNGAHVLFVDGESALLSPNALQSALCGTMRRVARAPASQPQPKRDR